MKGACEGQGAAPYGHVMVFAGGGTRLAYFLGLHAAACEAGHPPDLLLATCGGAWAAAVLHRLGDPAAARAWLMGPEAHEFIGAVRVAAHLSTPRALWRAAHRWLDRSVAPRVPDVWGDVLFEVDRPVPLPPAAPGRAGPDVAVVGARVLVPRSLAGQRRNGRMLFEETVFGPPAVAQHLAGQPCALAASVGTLAPTVATRTDVPLEQAVRISMTDLQYLSAPDVPRPDGSGAVDAFVGGFVDLCPIELARHLGQRISVERKPAFGSLLAEPALRHGLGLDPARRLRQVQAQHADWWLDTHDMRAAVPPLLRRRLSPHGLQVDAPATLADHADRVAQQWDYGFARGRAAFARGAQP